MKSKQVVMFEPTSYPVVLYTYREIWSKDLTGTQVYDDNVTQYNEGEIGQDLKDC